MSRPASRIFPHALSSFLLVVSLLVVSLLVVSLLVVCLLVPGCTTKPSPPPTSGARLEYVISLEFALEEDPGRLGMLAAAASVVRQRIESITPAYIGTEAPNRIIVDLPDVPDETIAAVKKRLSRSGAMIFTIADPDATEEQIEAVRRAGGETATHRLLIDSGNDREYLTLRDREVTDLALDSAHQTFDAQGAPAIGLHLWSQWDRFQSLASGNPGEQLIIALDREVILADSANSLSSGSRVIAGGFTAEEVEGMVALIRSPFGVPPTLVSETRYGSVGVDGAEVVETDD